MQLTKQSVTKLHFANLPPLLQPNVGLAGATLYAASNRYGEEGPMIYRMRTYSGISSTAAVFNEFFRTHLLPNQLKHGAKLVGRWQTEDDKIVAVWAYPSKADYLRIEEAVHRDPLSALAREARQSLPKLYETMEETFMVSTLAAT